MRISGSELSSVILSQTKGTFKSQKFFAFSRCQNRCFAAIRIVARCTIAAEDINHVPMKRGDDEQDELDIAKNI